MATLQTNNLISSDGKVRTGIFSEPVGEVNYKDFHLKTPMGKTAGPLRRWFGFNQFQFMSIISPEIIVGAAIVDTRLAVVCFVYIYNPNTREIKNYHFKKPTFGGFHKTSQQPDHGDWFFSSGNNRVDMLVTGNERQLKIQLADNTRIDMSFGNSYQLPMRICTPADLNGFAYTQKLAGVPCRGQVFSHLGDFDCEQIRATASLDWTAGYLRRNCYWNWVCLGAVLSDGRQLGLNGACGVNETSYTENCLWLDGQLYKLDSIIFEYDREDMHKPWHIRSGDRQLDVMFYPEGNLAERNNFLIMASNFQQMFGRFEGLIQLHGQDALNIKDIFGFTEEHFARW